MGKFGVKEICDVTLYSISTGKPVLYLDSLKMSTVDVAGDMVYATGGKGNNRLIGWDHSRVVTFNLQDALLDTTTLGKQVGTDKVTGTTTIHKREVLTAVDNAGIKITLTSTPLAGTMSFFLQNADGTMGDEVTGVENAGVVTFAAGVIAGDEVAAFYQYTSGATAELITLNSNTFPGYFKIVGDTFIRNHYTKADEAFQIVIEKAKIGSSFSVTIEAEGDPSVFDIPLEVFKPSDGTEMIKFIKY